jgi:S1-C subfamily serine protease
MPLKNSLLDKFKDNSQLIALNLLALGLIFWVVLIPDSLKRKDTNASFENNYKLVSERDTLISEIDRLQKSEQCELPANDILDDNQKTDLPLGEHEASPTLAKLEESVVLILAMDVESGELVQTGTGFFVSKNYLVTNSHVVKDENAKLLQIYILNKEIGLTKVSVVAATGFEEFDEQDFALLLSQQVSGVPLKLAKTIGLSSKKLTNVIAAGYPGTVLDTDPNFAKMLKGEPDSFPDLVVTSGKINSEQNFLGGVKTYIHDAQISSGNSGGPLVNYCSDILGINTFVVSEEKEGNRLFAISASELENFLKKTNVSYEIAEACQG